MCKIRFFRVENVIFLDAKPGLRGPKCRLSAQTVLHYIKQELLAGNNIFTIYCSHNEGVNIIGYNGNFPPTIKGCLVHRFKDKTFRYCLLQEM